MGAYFIQIVTGIKMGTMELKVMLWAFYRAIINSEQDA